MKNKQTERGIFLPALNLCSKKEGKHLKKKIHSHLSLNFQKEKLAVKPMRNDMK